MKFRVKIMACMLCLMSVLFGAGGSALILISFQNSLEGKSSRRKKLLSDASVHAAGSGRNGSVCRDRKYAERSPADDRAEGELTGMLFYLPPATRWYTGRGGSGGRKLRKNGCPERSQWEL